MNWTRNYNTIIIISEQEKMAIHIIIGVPKAHLHSVLYTVFTEQSFVYPPL